jgi:hypothetical protein
MKKMKNNYKKINCNKWVNRFIPIMLILILGIIQFSCKKSSNVDVVLPVSNPITKDSISGFLKGTMLSNKTYYMKGDIWVKSTDTLAVQSGVTVIVLGNPDLAPPLIYTLHISGTLLCDGTKNSQITFKPAASNPAWPKGYWGGIQCDSAAKFIRMQWTNISYTGGPDVSGGAQFAFSVVGVSGSFNSTTKVIVENCSFLSGIDDCMRLMGPINVSIKGNMILHQGSDDGDNINIKNGVTGDVAYNYIWSAANNSIKVITNKTVLYPQSKINIYNNTCIDGGWRKQGEPTAGILVDNFAQATLYNNLIINCVNGIRITKLADTTFIKGKFGYNLFYTIVDSTRNGYYPAGDWGKKQTGDIFSTGINNNNPSLMNLDSDIHALTDLNNAHLQSGSAAIGKGNTSAPYNTGLGTTMAPGIDIGCYQTNGSGNQR